MAQRIIGVMGAMPEEINGVLQLLPAAQQSIHAGRVYYEGRINNIKTVAVVSGWGKVAAAATVSALIHKFCITELIFTGVAGAINHSLKIGDIVIGARLLQHDMDARPFIPRYEIPQLKRIFFECDEMRLEIAKRAVQNVLGDVNLHTLIGEDALTSFKITHPRLQTGDIASGDQFFAGDEQKQNLLSNLPTVLCVEMEGAAVAQVCFENNIPFIIVRTISDEAGEGSHIDFAVFIEKIAGKYSAAIVKNIFDLL